MDQREAVGVRAGGVQPEQQVAGGDRPRQQPRALDHADAEAGEVVAAGGVHARHLGGLAAEQGAAGLPAAVGDAAHHLRGLGRVEPPAGVVVQEQQRPGAVGQDVVGAHRHQVDADGVAAAAALRQQQLAADAVGAAHQHRLREPGRQPVQAAEAAEAGQHAVVEGAPRQRADAPHQLRAGLEVDAGIAVAGGGGRIRHGHGFGGRILLCRAPRRIFYNGRPAPGPAAWCSSFRT